MKRVSFAVFTAVFMLALVPAFGQWVETRITGDGASPYTPKIWGDAVYWTDARNYQTGYVDIRKWTPSGGEAIIRQLPWEWGNDIEAIYQDRLVLMRGVSSSNWDLYAYDLATGVEIPITTAGGKQQNADIYEGTVVWEDHRGTYSQIYMWDEAGGERAVSPSTTNQTVPKIWGDRVVWDERTGDTPETYTSQVYSWTPSEGTQLVGYGFNPAIYDDRVVGWTPAKTDPYPPYLYQPGTLWEWTPGGGKVTLAEHESTNPGNNTDMWGDLIAWGSTNVGAWDPTNGFTRVPQGTGFSCGFPSVYDNQVAWVGNSNIYLSTLVPEPGSLLAFGSLAGGLGLAAWRRRC